MKPKEFRSLYPTFVRTITSSSEWKAWKKYVNDRMKEGDYRDCYDVVESEECGWISPEHWTAFCKFIRRTKEKK
jgi:hypothetical protein